jgi:hypothetical protein
VKSAWGYPDISAGRAVSLMWPSVAKAVVQVGWPPPAGILDKVVSKKIQVHACKACDRDCREVTIATLCSNHATIRDVLARLGPRLRSSARSASPRIA